MTQKRWPRPWICLLILSTLCAPLSVAHAGEVVCDKKDAKNCRQALAKDEQAAFKGYLLTPRKLAKLLAAGEFNDEREKLVRDEGAEKYRLMVQSYENRLTWKDVFHTRETDLLNESLDKATDLAKREWYEHPVFIATVSVLATSAAFYGAIKLVQKTD